jgi:hypothetical protein
VHRTLSCLQPQDEIAMAAKNIARFVRRLRFVSVYNWQPAPRFGFHQAEASLCPVCDQVRRDDAMIDALQYAAGYSAPAIGIDQRVAHCW